MKSTVSKIAYSNIAFVKYWGKIGRQLPINPSMSMLIKQCFTKFEIDYELSDRLEITNFLFEGEQNQKFSSRIEKYLNDISDVYPLSDKLKLSFRSENNFPHSTGIASSASAFAALAMCLTQIESDIKGTPLQSKRTSYLARLGSGSACRSISSSDFNLWGKTRFDLGDDDFSVDLENLSFSSPLIDTVLVVDEGTKKVSSSAGHALMNGHAYRENRVEQAHENIRSLYGAIKNDDFEHFGSIIENEALSLHAMMMTSMPSYILMNAKTFLIIEKLKDFREQGKINAYFTLDAGPNIHLIYQKKDKEQVESVVKSELAPLANNIIWGSLGE